MRVASKILLGFMGVVVPVIVAACYGVPYRYSKTGRVVDSQTKAGITGIKVSCIRDGDPWDSTFTDDAGSFDVWYDVPCDELLVEDVDQEENGLYRGAQVPFSEDGADPVIELERVE